MTMPQISKLAQTGLMVITGIPAFSMLLTALPARAEDSRLSSFFSIGIGATAENVTIDTDSATYAIKKIELKGSGLTNKDLAALLDPKDSTSLTGRFEKLSASEILIPELTVTTKSAPVQKTTYQNIKLSEVKQGKAKTAEIEAARFSIIDEKAGTITGNYGHLHAQAVDLTLAAHVLSDARKDDSELLKTLYESFSLDGFEMNGGGKDALSMTIANISGRNVRARAFAMRPSDFQTAANDPAHASALIKDIFTSLEMEDLTASNLEIATESEGKPVTISLGQMSFANFGNARIGDIGLKNLAVNAPGAAAKIGDIDFKGLDFQTLREISAVVKPKDAGADGSQQTNAYIPSLSHFSMNKINVVLSDTASAAPGANGAFSIDHFQIDSDNPVNSVPTQMTATLDHFILDLSSLKAEDVKTFTDMGYSKLDLSSRIDMVWNPEAEELNVKDISISGVNMGAVTLSALIDNVTKEFFSPDTATMQAAALSASIKKVDIRIDNSGLFEKATAAQAKSQNKSIEEIKRTYVSAAAVSLPAMLGNKPAAKLIGAALAKFVANPKSFHLTAISADGLGAADFALISDPVTLLDALEIKATANE